LSSTLIPNADHVDVSKYERQGCPLSKGAGSFFDRDCPECGGEGNMPIGAAEQVDLSKYDLVKCPPCRSNGAVDGYDCRVCNGDKRILRMHADQL
jgi:DnaJ-class molecular chaperone